LIQSRKRSPAGRSGKLKSDEQFYLEDNFLKSLPTSLACPRQEKDGEREE
jgi:hypothetical protein